MNKQSNLSPKTIIFFFCIILLLSVYAVLSQEENLTNNNSLMITDNDSGLLQENNSALASDVIPNNEIIPYNNSELQLDNLTNQVDTTNQTNSTTNESSMIALEENVGIMEEKTDIVKEIQESDKVTIATKEFLANSKDNDNKKFIIKYDFSFDITKLQKFSEEKNIYMDRVAKFEGKIADLEEILNDNSVEYIEIDQDLNLLEDATPWNVERVGATAVRNFSLGIGVKIAILDIGISEHSDLSIAGGWNIIDDSDDYTDNQGHGTAVAGVLGAVINDEGLIGVSPDASIYAVKIMESESGQLSDAIAGIQWAIDNNMNIISMSFGFNGYSQIFKEVLQDAYNQDILIVGAAGNDGIEGVVYPAAYDKVIAVGATDENNNRASISNYGPELELMAPGVDINSTGLYDSYIMGSGTSLAVPHVAGVAALIWASNTTLSNTEVRAKLRNDALDLGSPGKDDYYGYGLVKVNLTSENYTYNITSYYYEVFNITDYRLENESHLFWLNGTGTIDDVNFSQGYYLIIKDISGIFINQTINVTENGTIVPLIDVIRMDNWFEDGGTTSDGVIWEDSYYVQMKVTTSSHDVEIWNYNSDSGTSMDECFFRDSATYDACNDLCYGVPYSIGSTYIGGWHYVINEVSIRKDSASVWTYSSSCSFSGSEDSNYYVVDQKKNVCTDANNYILYGRYGTGANDWADYSTSYTCGTGSGCDSAQDEQTCTTQSCTPQNPCRRLENYSCNMSNGLVTDDCYTGLNCTNNVCRNLNATTDLEVLDIIVMQTVKDVPMILQKTGIIRVRVRNNGNLPVTIARVNLTAPTLEVSGLDFQEKPIAVGETVKFDWWFKPIQTGTNINISANVEIVS